MAPCLTLPATSGALLTAGSQSTAQRGQSDAAADGPFTGQCPATSAPGLLLPVRTARPGHAPCAPLRPVPRLLLSEQTQLPGGCALVRAGPGLGADRQAGAQEAHARPQFGSRRHASRGTEAPACTDKRLGSEPRPSARAATLTPSLRGPGTTLQRSPRPPLPTSPGRRRNRDLPGPPARGGSAHVRRAPPPGGSAPSPQDAPGAASWRRAFKPANRRPAPRPPRRV